MSEASVDMSSSAAINLRRVGHVWLWAGLAALTVIVLFFETSHSIYAIWMRSDTYAHGFIIPPLAAWLIWRDRLALARLPSRPAWIAVPVLMVIGAGWILVKLVGIQMFEQLALVAMVISAIWLVIGTAWAKRLLFPLFFLFFAVPMGAELTDPMMEFTADFTVAAVQLSGVPVYREGLYFTLPTGSWSIVEACSGVRYLIASITLGFLYAYLSYRALWRRLVFIALSVVVPVFANGVRAYMIVMLGHLSDMELAVGVDHLVYGWVFFGLVMFLLFWIGSFWEDPPEKLSDIPVAPDLVAPRLSQFLIALALVAGSGALMVTAFAGVLARGDVAHVELSAPRTAGKWQMVDFDLKDWRPQLVGKPVTLRASYSQGGEPVHVFVALYPNQAQGHEAVNADHKPVVEDAEHWRVALRGHRDTGIAAVPGVYTARARWVGPVEQGIGGEMTFWHWYRLGERNVTNALRAKLNETLNRLTSGRGDGAYVVLMTKADAGADGRLEAFTREAYPVLAASLDTALGRD